MVTLFRSRVNRGEKSNHRYYIAGTILVSLTIVLAACEKSTTDLNMPQLEQNPMVVPAGFPMPVVPSDNPITPAKASLGRSLFYDKSLSSSGSVSCANCHSVSNGFSDTSAVSMGVRQEGSRNALPLINVAYDTTFFWDGRAHSLEAQAGMPIMNPLEMANDSATVVNTLNQSPFYRSMFASAFGDNSAVGNSITFTRVEQALATFERTFISGNSAYDRFIAGDSSALNASQLRGFALFKQDSCASCHSGVNFSDNSYHSTGLTPFYSDEGREDVSNSSQDNGKFRTPTLRNIALTAPYEHDGSMKTLLQVVDHYNNGGEHNSTQDPRIKDLNLTQSQEQDLISFLNSLTDYQFVNRSDFKNPGTK
ncbi:MAG TPA: cytochrome c peroxidase [Candidatus Kapabacteria bacterium]